MRRALVACAMAVLGCGFTETHEVVLRSAPPRVGDVAVFMAGQRVERPFYELALVQAVGHGSEANGEDAVRGLVERGRALGCDAIVQVQVDEGYTLGHAAGVCVKYTRIDPKRAEEAEKPKPEPPAEPAHPEPEDDAPSDSPL